MPSLVNSNIENGVSPYCWAIELTRILMELPMRVQTPPSMEANDMDMRSLEGLASISRAIPRTMGINMAMRAIWLTKAERAPIASIKTTSADQKLRLPILARTVPAKLTAPVLESPALRTNKA